MTGSGIRAGDRAVICGIGYWLPARVVTNAELCARLDTFEDWILSRTGISSRRWVGPGEATSDLAVEAGSAALSGTVKPDHRVLLVAFGGGLTWGAATLTWPELDIHGA